MSGATVAYAVEQGGESLLLCTRTACSDAALTPAEPPAGDSSVVTLDQEAMDGWARNTGEAVTCDKCGAVLAEPHGEPDPPPRRRK